MAPSQKLTRIRIYQPVRILASGVLRPLPIRLPQDFRLMESIPGWGLYLAGTRQIHSRARAELAATLKSSGWQGVMAQAYVPGSLARPRLRADLKAADDLLRCEVVQMGKLPAMLVRALATRFGFDDAWSMTLRELLRRMPKVLADRPELFPHAKVILFVLRPAMVADRNFIKDTFPTENSFVRYALVRRGAKVHFSGESPWPER